MKVDAPADARPLAADRPSWLDRRLPQLLGAYLAGAWTGFQFVQWLTDRFVLSPYVEDVYLLTLLLLTPSVVLLAYRHGARGAQPFRRAERIAIPCNLLGAGALLVLLFGGKDLGSAREVVTLVGDDGETIERAIPKSAFRKRVAVFAFAAPPEAPDDAWLVLGLPELVSADLAQEPFIQVATGRQFAARIQEAGFDTPDALPLALQRDLARAARYDFVLSGRIERAADGYRLDARLVHADTGREKAAHVASGADVLALVDALTLALKRRFELPQTHIDETPDMPVAEVMSASLPALRAYMESLRLSAFLRNPAGALATVEQALALDPTFAFAHLQHYQVLNLQGLQQDGLAALARTQQHSYRLPEPVRFALKAWSFFLNKQPDAALQAARQWHALYPEDTQALILLTDLHKMRRETDEAIAAMRRIEVLDPAASRALEIGDLLRDEGDLDAAAREYERYAERFPERQEGYRRLGSIHRARGDLDAEADAYARALVAEPDDPSIATSQAEVAFRQGRLDDAERAFQRGLHRARTPRERTNALFRYTSHLWIAGDYERYVAYSDTLMATNETHAGAGSSTMTRAMIAWRYARAGFAERALADIAAARAHRGYGSNDMLDLNVDLGAALVDLELGRPIDRDALLAQSRAVMEGYGLAGTNIAYFQGLLALGTRDFGEARTAFEQQLEVTPTGELAEATRLGLAEALAALGLADEARAAYRDVLRTFPSHPEAHLGLARLALPARPAEARGHLEQALATWRDASPRHAGAAEARRLLEDTP